MLVVPAIGVGLLLLQNNNPSNATLARHTALWISVLNFIISLVVWANFDNTSADYQFSEQFVWFKPYQITYHVGIDGISLFFVLLSTLLTPICIWSCFDAVQTRVRDYMIAFLVLEIMMIGSFIALDLFVFYIFFEGVLLPMFIIIGIWGGKNRVYASYKFFLYTLLGSVLMLLAMFLMTAIVGSSDFSEIAKVRFPKILQYIFFIAFFASFAVKVPMWPVHTWLPDAHVEAPTAGSVILAGVLLKMGGYGFLRFSLGMFPDVSQTLSPMMLSLAAIAVIYTSLVALVQHDMKKLIAYSSVAHMGFVIAGLFSFNIQGITGAMLVMISHGLVSSALFLIVGVIYDRIHTREIAAYGGLVNRMPKYAVIFMFFTMASVGLPGTSGFVGEFLVLAGIFQYDTIYGSLIALGMVLGAAYALYLYRQVIFGVLDKANLQDIMDCNKRELIIFAILIILTIWIGIYPQIIIDPMTPSLQRIINNFTKPEISASIQNLSPIFSRG